MTKNPIFVNFPESFQTFQCKTTWHFYRMHNACSNHALKRGRRKIILMVIQQTKNVELFCTIQHSCFYRHHIRYRIRSKFSFHNNRVTVCYFLPKFYEINTYYPITILKIIFFIIGTTTSIIEQV